MARRIKTNTWEQHRSTIVRLYIENGERLEDVMSYMEREENFSASKFAYKKKLGRWNVLKRRNVSKDTLSTDRPRSENTNDELSTARGITPNSSNTSMGGADTLPLRHLPTSTSTGQSLSELLATFSANGSVPYPPGPSTRSSTSNSPPPLTTNALGNLSLFNLSTSLQNMFDFNDLHETDFDDEDAQESQHLQRQLCSLLQSFVNTGGFSPGIVVESLEELFAVYEKQAKLQLLEKVLAADLLMFGSQSPIFCYHARRFCDVVTRVETVPFGQDISAFARALQFASMPFFDSPNITPTG